MVKVQMERVGTPVYDDNDRYIIGYDHITTEVVTMTEEEWDNFVPDLEVYRKIKRIN